MDSFQWKCKYCRKRFRVAEVMLEKRVRCPACAAFSKARIRYRKKTSKLPEPHFNPAGGPRKNADPRPAETQDASDGIARA